MIDPKVFKQVRKKLGLTQADLATALGLSRITVNKMERGKLVRGIPDDVGARLLALKPKPNPFEDAARGRDPAKAKYHLDEAHEFATGHAVDDADLWDNEEDES